MDLQKFSQLTIKSVMFDIRESSENIAFVGQSCEMSILLHGVKFSNQMLPQEKLFYTDISAISVTFRNAVVGSFMHSDFILFRDTVRTKNGETWGKCPLCQAGNPGFS